MTALGGALAFVFGLALGSFANVIVYRVPRGLSIVSPPSACPRCNVEIKPWHNVPVLGWLWLRGRCASCGEPISARYPLIELGTGVAFAAVWVATGPSASTGVLLGLVYFGIVLSAIDIELRRLPNPITLAFAVVTVIAIVGAAAATGDWDGALRALWGALILGAFYFVAFLVYPKGMGFGDVKLAPVIGAVLGSLGWAELSVGAFAAFLWGGVFGLVQMARQRHGRGVAIPFGPWMFAGAVTGAAVGPPVADWYLRLAGL